MSKLTAQGDVILTVRVNPVISEELDRISGKVKRPVSELIREGILVVIGVYRDNKPE